MSNTVSMYNGSSVLPPDAYGSEQASVGLSPDALMAYCQSRLDSVDDQVKTSFADQQRNTASITQIDTVLGQLKNSDGSDVTTAADCKQLEKDFGALIQYLKANDPGCSQLPALTTAYNTMVYSGDGGKAFTGSTDPDDPDFIDGGQYPPSTGSKQGDNLISSTELQGYVQTLSDAAGNLNSNSELEMVQLQSLMSQRQTAVSLTTNLVQSLGDQENKIADNIGK